MVDASRPALTTAWSLVSALLLWKTLMVLVLLRQFRLRMSLTGMRCLSWRPLVTRLHPIRRQSLQCCGSYSPSRM